MASEYTADAVIVPEVVQLLKEHAVAHANSPPLAALSSAPLPPADLNCQCGNRIIPLQKEGEFYIENPLCSITS